MYSAAQHLDIWKPHHGKRFAFYGVEYRIVVSEFYGSENENLVVRVDNGGPGDLILVEAEPVSELSPEIVARPQRRGEDWGAGTVDVLGLPPDEISDVLRKLK